MVGIALTTQTPLFLANAHLKTLSTSATTSPQCGTKGTTTIATERAEVVTLAHTLTNSQRTTSLAVTVAIMGDTTPQGKTRINPRLFSVPQTGVPARIWICQVISTFFSQNAADPNNRSHS